MRADKYTVTPPRRGSVPGWLALALGLGVLAASAVAVARPAAAAPAAVAAPVAADLGQRTPEELATARRQTKRCLECHADMADDDVVEFDDGSELVVLVEEDAWAGSVHAAELGCTDCHAGHAKYPHSELAHGSAREYQVASAESCTECHYAYYTRALDGIHYSLLAAGRLEAPTCVDCHGAHAVHAPATPRTGVDERCARCHAEISETYRSSVHGVALLNGDPDVPTCTDCHGAHAIRDPRGEAFHVSSHEICAQCHADEERMERHGLNPDVIKTYLADFHGVSNQLYAAGAGLPNQPMASCVDCHGVHDIQAFDDSGSEAVVRARVEAVCARCHEGAPVGFSNAWMRHYEPTFRSAPMVAMVVWAYRILIPLIACGLISHILLHLWRYQSHR